MSKKRSILALILALILTLSFGFTLTGCGDDSGSKTSDPPANTDTPPTDAPPTDAPPTDDPPPSEDVPKSDVTLTYIIDRDTDQAGSKAVMERFTEITGIKFEEELRPGGAEGETLLKTRFATGDAPDFIWFNSGSLLATLDPVRNLVDLSSQSYMSKLQESYKQTVSMDGKVFGIPGRTSMGGGWLYNKKLHDDLGLTVPTSWSALIDNCQKAKDAGKTAVIGSYSDSWTAQLIPLADYANLAAVAPNFAADFDAERATYAGTPAAVRSFEKLAEINEKGFMNADYLATTYDLALEMLVKGDGLYYPMLTFALDGIVGNWPDEIDNIGLFAQPADDAANTALTVWMPDGWYACQGSDHFDEVNRFFEFYLSEEAQGILANKSSGNGPSVVAGAPSSPNVYQAVKEMQPYFDAGKTAPAIEFITSVKGPNLPQICVEVGSGMTTPAKGAANYDQDVEKERLQQE
ncbi:MAG: ABC transporter substrate-binding protein [Oscillospiraceae bacterium]|nr:ABC transporter substrate-binding protein [Oscillospiraceae bacterium]